MARYQVTIRYGRRFQRYHTFVVEAEDAVAAMGEAAAGAPDEVRGEADLVEVREAVDPDARAYLGEDAP